MVNMEQNQFKCSHLNKRSIFLLPLFYLGMIASPNSAYAINWEYVNGSSGYDHADGKPSNMTDQSSLMPADLLTKVQELLPEGISISANPKVLAMLANSEGANIKLKAPADISVSYIFEKADYLSAIGYFKFPKDNLASLTVSTLKDTIIFPNFSDSVLQYGQSVKLGSFQAGDAIGFTMAADGWYQGEVDPNQSVNNIFRTIKRLNPEKDSKLQDHTLLLAYPEKELMVVMFEDLNRENAALNHYSISSDDDFNDAIIAVQVSPWSSVDCSNCNYLVPPTTTTTSLKGESGQISWREITAPVVVADPLKDAKAAAKAAEEAAKNSVP